MPKPPANTAPRLTPAPTPQIPPSGRGDTSGHTAEPGQRPARPAKPAKLSAPTAASNDNNGQRPRWAPSQDRPAAQLISDASKQLSRLVRDEMRLAVAELQQKG